MPSSFLLLQLTSCSPLRRQRRKQSSSRCSFRMSWQGRRRLREGYARGWPSEKPDLWKRSRWEMPVITAALQVKQTTWIVGHPCLTCPAFWTDAVRVSKLCIVFLGRAEECTLSWDPSHWVFSGVASICILSSRVNFLHLGRGVKQCCHSCAPLHLASLHLRCHRSVSTGVIMCGIVTSATVESEQAVASQALAAAEQRASEYEGLLADAQLKFKSVAKHRKSAQKQLDAQEEDLEHLGHRLKVSHPSSRIQSLFVTSPHKCCLPA